MSVIRRYSRQVASLLVSLAVSLLFASPCVEAQTHEVEAPLDWSKIANRWEDWRDHLRLGYVATRFDYGENSAASGEYLLYRSGKFFVYQETETHESATRARVILRNPKYLATISRDNDDDEYKIETLRLNSPAMPGLDNSRYSVFAPLVIWEEDLVQAVRQHELFSVVNHTRNQGEGGAVHEVVLRFAKEHPLGELGDIEMTLAEGIDWLPTRRSIVYPDEVKISAVFRDWRKVGGSVVWSNADIDSVYPDGRSEQIRYVNDWEAKRKLSKRHCWLSHYGLSEPDTGNKLSASMILGLFGLALLLVVGAARWSGRW
jgi:hypothetical protein